MTMSQLFLPCKDIKGLLTVAKEGKKNIFSGRIIEFEGLAGLSVDKAYELTNSSAERSAAAATIRLSVDAVSGFLEESISILKDLTENRYGDVETIKRRIRAMEDWMDDPNLLEPDEDAEYEATLEVDLSKVREPILACPNDPDDVKKLSEVAGTKINEVFIGSCMTGLSHYKAAGDILEGKDCLPTRLWITPATRMDA